MQLTGAEIIVECLKEGVLTLFSDIRAVPS